MLPPPPPLLTLRCRSSARRTCISDQTVLKPRMFTASGSAVGLTSCRQGTWYQLWRCRATWIRTSDTRATPFSGQPPAGHHWVATAQARLATTHCRRWGCRRPQALLLHLSWRRCCCCWWHLRCRCCRLLCLCRPCCCQPMLGTEAGPAGCPGPCTAAANPQSQIYTIVWQNRSNIIRGELTTTCHATRTATQRRLRH